VAPSFFWFTDSMDYLRVNPPGKGISDADRHRLEVQAGVKLDIENLGGLLLRGDKCVQSGKYHEAVEAYRHGLQFSIALLGGEEHIWTASIAGRLAYAMEFANKGVFEEEINRLSAITRNWFNNKKQYAKTKRLQVAKRTGTKRCNSATTVLSLDQVRNGLAPRIGSNASPFVLKLNNLTPRSLNVCRATGTQPSTLQKRDQHSFYEPGLTFTAQVELSKRHEKHRLEVLDKLIEDRKLLILELESQERTKVLDTKMATEAELKRRRRWKSCTDKKIRRPKNEPPPVVPVPDENPHKGAYEAATMIALEWELYCDACGTVYDFKSERCRTCTKLVNWKKVIERSENKFGKLLSSQVLVDPAPAFPAFPAIGTKFAQDIEPSPKGHREWFRRSKGLKARTTPCPNKKSWVSIKSHVATQRLDNIDDLLGAIQRENKTEASLQIYLLNEKEKHRRSQIASLSRGAGAERILDKMERHGNLSVRDKIARTKYVSSQFWF